MTKERISTVFLDAGGVLLFPNWGRVRSVLTAHGIKVDTKTLASSEQTIRFDLDSNVIAPKLKAGQGDWRFLDLVLNRACVPPSPARRIAVRGLRRYHAARNLWETVPADVLPALRRLRKLGMTIAVVSNSNGTVRSALSRVGLSDHLDLIVDSHEEGIAKPNPRLFEIALKRANARPDATVHLGDMYSVDVLGARAAGLQAVLFDKSGLYAGFECHRVKKLEEFVRRVEENDLA